MTKRPSFSIGEEVWCCDLDGYVFQGRLTKAGPRSFKFGDDWHHRKQIYHRHEIFKREIQARYASKEPLERELIRVAEQLGDVRHRIAELEREQQAQGCGK